MANYLIRVELHGDPPKSLYKDLHESMSSKGFLPSFLDGGQRYELPHAMYLIKTELPPIRILNLVKEVVSKLWKDSEVLVAEYVGKLEHDNLRLAK